MEIASSAAGTLVTVSVRPRSRRGLEVVAGRLVIRVNAAPVEGKATEEARRALAAALGVAASAVTLRSGERSKTKVFLIRGVDPDQARTRLTSAFQSR
jgi:hypothetical protein